MTHHPKLGKRPLPDDERDAIHIAVIRMKATHRLVPGEHVGMAGDGLAGPVSRKNIGVVDPFLTEEVQPGEDFWLCLYPETITSLRHAWSHPVIDGGIGHLPNGDWLAAFAAQIGQTPDQLMAAAHSHVDYGEYAIQNTEGYKNVRPGDWEEFWRRFEQMTNKKARPGAYAPYSCAC